MKPTSRPLSKNLHLIRWVKKMAALCQPDAHPLGGRIAGGNTMRYAR